MSITCAGCGAFLPPGDWVIDPRVNASGACLERRARVLGFEADHMVAVGHLHQLTVDAYGAQHGGPRAPAIAVPFALIGLHLALDAGMSGLAVRGAHQHLARGGGPWPAFVAPAAPAWSTAADVAAATGVAAYVAAVHDWAASVWAAWRQEHERVRAWAEAELPPEVRARIAGGAA